MVSIGVEVYSLKTEPNIIEIISENKEKLSKGHKKMAEYILKAMIKKSNGINGA